jgi:hypothetical protein
MFLTLSEAHVTYLWGQWAQQDKQLIGSLDNNRHCMLVNWLGNTGTCLTGEQAAARFKDALSVRSDFSTLTTRQMENFALELFEIG